MDTVKYNPPDQHYIQLDIIFATAYGVNEALLFAKLYRLQERLTGKIDENGKKWIRLTLEEWQQELPFLKEMTLRRTIESCEEQSLILSRTFTGRSKWYLCNSTFVSVQNEQLYMCNLNNPTVQNEQLPRVLPILNPNTLSLPANGNQPVRDYLSDIQAKAQSGVNESTAPNPQDQYWQYRDNALKAVASLLSIPNQVEKEDVTKLIDSPGFSAILWEQSIRETARHYSGGGKIARAIEVYRVGGTYAAWREKNYPQQQKGSNYGNGNFGRKNQAGNGGNGQTGGTKGHIIPQSVGLGPLAFPPASGDANPAGA